MITMRMTRDGRLQLRRQKRSRVRRRVAVRVTLIGTEGEKGIVLEEGAIGEAIAEIESHMSLRIGM